MTLKRDLVKYVRDKAKSQYKKDTHCYICGSTEELDFHHFYGLTELFESWCKKKGITIKTEDEILDKEKYSSKSIERKFTKVLLHYVICII